MSRSRRLLWLMIVVPVTILGAVLFPLVGTFWERTQGPAVWHFDDPALTTEATSGDYKQLGFGTVERLVADLPDRAESHHAFARFHKSLGKTQIAKEHWERCATIDPNFAKAYEGMAVLADEGGDFEIAAKMFREAIRCAPDDHALAPLLADSLFNALRFGEAVAVLRDHMARQKTTAKALLTLAHSELALGNFEQAKAAFEAMVQNFGDDREKSALSTAYWGLSRVSLRLGDKERAVQYLEQYKKFAPVDQEIIEGNLKHDDQRWLKGVLVETLWGAGQVYQRFGDLHRAEVLWQQTAQLEGKHQACRLALLAQYERAERYADALVCAEQLRDIHPGNAEYWWNVGLINSRLGRFEVAIEALQQAVTLDPDNSEYRTALQWVRTSAQ